MVIAPHPDDETLGCGGTMLKFKDKGVHLTWVIATKMTSKLGYTHQQIKKRELEIKEVAKAYGIQKPLCMGYAPAQIDRVGLDVLVNDFRTLIHDLKPDTIFIPNRTDIHSDHRIISQACLSAVKPFRCPWVKNILMYEVISETDLNQGLPEAVFNPQIFVDISSFMERKIEIMKLFSTEMAKSPFPRSEEKIRAMASCRGGSLEMHYAESFMLLRGLN